MSKTAFENFVVRWEHQGFMTGKVTFPLYLHLISWLQLPTTVKWAACFDHVTAWPLYQATAEISLVSVAPNNQVTLLCSWYICHTTEDLSLSLSVQVGIHGTSPMRMPSLTWEILFPLTITLWCLQIGISLFTHMEHIWSRYLSIQQILSLFHWSPHNVEH